MQAFECFFVQGFEALSKLTAFTSLSEASKTKYKVVLCHDNLVQDCHVPLTSL